MRRETGVLRQPGDWPGFFLRGDDAMRLANDMEMLADAIEGGNMAAVDVPGWLRLRASTFRMVRVKDRDPPLSTDADEPERIWGGA